MTQTAMSVAIDALSDPDVQVQDALRRLYVATRRMEASGLSEWLRSELNGYEEGSPLPDYRSKRFPIRLTFNGPMNSSAEIDVSVSELPAELTAPLEYLGLHEPVAELSALATGTKNPGMNLAMIWVEMYRRLAEEKGLPRMHMMVLNEARLTIPRSHLHGILDRIRSTALDLALDLEDLSPTVGSPGGPTVAEDPELARAATVYLTKIYGSDPVVTIAEQASVAAGDGSTAVQIVAGDIESLLRAAKAYLSNDALEDLARALDADEGTQGKNTNRFLAKVQGGGVALASGVSGNAAYEGLLQLIEAFGVG
ncbi:MAG: hypothetical protein WBA72_10655 [Ornithinimicrobium sp.]